jgi:glycosyltransferase involved in cell wall biosynthesis
MPKVLFLSRYARLGSSSRLRLYQYLPYLRDAGVDVTLAPLFGDDYVRGLYGGKVAKLSVLKAYVARLGIMFRADRFDAVWVEKEMLPWVPAWLELGLFPAKVPLIVDYDDAVFHRYDQHRLSLVRGLLGRKIDRVMQRADLVVAGNEYLANHARIAGAARVEILPTVVDIERYGVSTPERGGQQLPTIGWIGSPATAKFLHLIAPALREVVARNLAQVVAVGANAGQLSSLPITALPWTEATEVNDIQRFDIGIMPLPDAPFERGKCGYKLIQYMACGKPVVASPVGVNSTIVRDGVDGFLASTHREWVSALTRLIADRVLRQQMGREGRRRIELEFSLKKAAPRFATLIDSVIK